MFVFLNYNLRTPEWGTPSEDLYAACLDQCSWADQHGFAGVRINEHHRTDDGYIPSPIVLGGAIAARTEKLRIRISLIVLPLHDPVRIAEDIAVLDILSRGRTELVVGAGYVAEEFQMFGRDVADRLELLERGVDALRLAMSGDEFELAGRRVKVTPRPYRGRTIPIVMGGSSVRAARQAAKLADGFEPAPQRFVSAYVEACAALGRPTGWYPAAAHGFRTLHVARDPDRTWDRIKRFAAHDNAEYAKWSKPMNVPSGYRAVEDPDELRMSGSYRVVTPEECIEILKPLGSKAEVHLYPLLGGMDPEIGWESLRLFHAEVMPALVQ